MEGTIFSPDLLAQGQEGGHRAAKMLFESVRQYFMSAFQLDVDQKNFWVHIFYNKRGLMDAIGHAGHWAAKQGFEGFSLGFNQAAERFIMVDVGHGKEAADAKVKVMLDYFIRLPQTSKILFGGKMSCISSRLLLTVLFDRLSRQWLYHKPSFSDDGRFQG